jgi:thioredoxin 1
MSSVIHVSDASFEKEVLKSDQPVLVDFWAPWCGPCRMIAPELDRLSEEMKGQVIVAKVNVDENPVSAMKYRVSSIPTMKLFQHGKDVQTIIGFKSSSYLKQLIQGSL